ncbi:Translation initiation factor 3 subunit b [Boothiomyces macroporosus]|uniref:Eukaryotic translation initiation factor 3 subunit B n=1 Tax=Boothiomyces macroporosus TaxID=261099 RepID=A0AAD5UMX7_9FUNG|nr:Translation initiation factor 3 subunit b [Boothiomyces macroporosus]
MEEDYGLDFSDIEAQYAVQVPNTFDNIVVVDNVPVVDEAKEEKLLKVIRKIFSSAGTIKPDGITMPKNPNGKSKGFLFMEFESAADAQKAIATLDGYKMDKAHVLVVSKFDDIETFAEMSDEFEEVQVEPYVEKEHLKSWLSDPKARDQFAIMKGDEVGIYFNNKSESPDRCQSKSNWSDLFISWSSYGSYFVTIHKQGIALWGGPSWQKINRFPHPNVTMVDFSPKENYVMTWSPDAFKTPDGQLHNICIWDVKTATLLRSFPTPATKEKAGKENIFFKWSFDDKYVAKMTPGAQGAISVYELPSMGLLDKKSFKVENLMDFYWSPTENVLSYWTPEIGNIPARVTIVSVPSRNIVRTKNFFNVIACKLYWQSNGEYLLVKVDRNKTKTTTITSFEVFRMKEKDIPVDVVELKVSEELIELYWEPKGNKFAILTAENNNQTLNFYEVQPKSAATTSAVGVKQLKQVDAKNISSVCWSPKGRFCVLAGLKGMAGTLEFWDTEDFTKLGAGEHYMCTDIEWDPTGRYVVTSVSYWRVQNDTGLIMWTLAGQELTKQYITGFKQFAWRPRPPTLLSAEDQKKLKKNLKEYSKQFDEEDALESNKASADVQEKRRAQWEEYKALLAKFRAIKESEREERIAIYGFDPEAVNEDVEEVEETIEVVLEESEEIIE